MTGFDPSQFPVEHLAQLLVQRARRDPSLQSRSPANSNQAVPEKPPKKASQPDPLPELQKLYDFVLADWKAEAASNSEPDAASSDPDEAWQADPDEAWRPSQTTPTNRRGVMLAAGFGALAFLIGVAALASGVLNRSVNTRLATVTGEVHAPDVARPAFHAPDVAGPHVDQPVAVFRAAALTQAAPVAPLVEATPIAARPELAITAPVPSAPAQSVATRPLPPVIYSRPAEYRPPQPVTYSQPVDYRPPPPPYRPLVRQYRPVRHRIPTVAMIVASVRRDVRSLFR